MTWDLSSRFDIIHSHCIWHRQAASLDALWSKTQIGGMQTACCDAAEACSIPEARRCVADHYVAGKLQRCNATTVHLQGHTASILACSAGPGIIASASEDKVGHAKFVSVLNLVCLLYMLEKFIATIDIDNLLNMNPTY